MSNVIRTEIREIGGGRWQEVEVWGEWPHYGTGFVNVQEKPVKTWRLLRPDETIEGLRAAGKEVILAAEPGMWVTPE